MIFLEYRPVFYNARFVTFVSKPEPTVATTTAHTSKVTSLLTVTGKTMNTLETTESSQEPPPTKGTSPKALIFDSYIYIYIFFFTFFLLFVFN